MEKMTVLYEVGARDSPTRALGRTWYKGNEFRAIRDKRSMRERR